MEKNELNFPRERPAPVQTVDDLDLIEYDPTQRSKEDCTVCLQLLQRGILTRILPCNHAFHQSCVDPWLIRQYTCPTCTTQAIMPLATPVGIELNNPSLHGTCRGCSRRYFLDSTLNPSSAGYFRCEQCRRESMVTFCAIS